MPKLPDNPLDLLALLPEKCAGAIAKCGGKFLVATLRPGDGNIQLLGTLSLVDAAMSPDGKKVIKRHFAAQTGTSNEATLRLLPRYHSPPQLASSKGLQGAWAQRTATIQQLIAKLQQLPQPQRQPPQPQPAFAVYLVSGSLQPVQAAHPEALLLEPWWQCHVAANIAPEQQLPRLQPAEASATAAARSQAAGRQRSSSKRRRVENQPAPEPTALAAQPQAAQPLATQPPATQPAEQPPPQAAASASPSASPSLSLDPFWDFGSPGGPPEPAQPAVSPPPQLGAPRPAAPSQPSTYTVVQYLQKAQLDPTLWPPVALTTDAWAMCDLRIGAGNKEYVSPEPVKVGVIVCLM